MTDERNPPSGSENKLGDRLASIIAESGVKPNSADPFKAAAPPANHDEWHVIHAGQELGPLPLVEMIEKAAAGEIEADDLVKQAGCPWTKAREVDLLLREFTSRKSREKAINQLGQFHGVWVSKYAFVCGGCVLLGVALTVAWIAINPFKSPAPILAEKNAAPPPGRGEKKDPDLVVPEDAKEAEAQVYFNRGVSAFYEHDDESAIKDFNECIRLNPNWAECYSYRGRAYVSAKNYDMAIKDFTKAIKLEPKFTRYFTERAGAWIFKQDLDMAINDYTEAIRVEPDIAYYYYQRGQVWSAKKDYDMVIKDFGEAIRIEPSAYFYGERGRVWSERKNYDMAIKDFSEAIRLKPNDAFYFAERAYAWSDSKNPDKAISDFSEAIRIKPTGAHYFISRAFALCDVKQFGSAIEDFDEAFRLDPKYAEKYKQPRQDALRRMIGEKNRAVLARVQEFVDAHPKIMFVGSAGNVQWELVTRPFRINTGLSKFEQEQLLDFLGRAVKNAPYNSDQSFVDVIADLKRLEFNYPGR